MRAAFIQLWEWLFGPIRPGSSPTRLVATSLIHQIAHGGIRSLTDEQLMAVVDLILDRPGLRRGLRGNVRFLGSVSGQYRRKREISAKQRQGLYNVLERAYPHNLAAELRNM